MKKILSLLLISMAMIPATNAQDLPAARKMLDTLSSATFWGRGYTNGGMNKAATFIADKFREAGLKPLSGNDYKQEFSYPANTFPGNMSLIINGKKLIPGKDFIVSPCSRGLKATATLQQKDSVTFLAVADRLLIQLEDKLTWSVAQQQDDYTAIQVSRQNFHEVPQTASVDIQNEFIPQFKANNVCAMVRGTKHPDSMIMMTAHYDHLGGMGRELFFPGANDNGSGITLLLSLASYYAQNPPPYSIVFICFAGEEAGILGSKYFTEHPLVALDQIRFLINMDMVGTGDTGITVVNATLHAKEFALLNQINDKRKYLIKINPRGKAANSDHYFFTEKGVPAFFIYTQGGIAAYHDVNDIAKTLPMNEFKDLYRLFIDFNRMLMP